SRTILADGDHAQSDWAEYDLAGTRRSIADGARRASEMRRACVKLIDGRSRVTLPCGGAALRIEPDRDAYGPVAVAPDGTAYTALANDRGTVDVWSVPPSGGRARQLTAFSRDTYAPTVSADGSGVFKVQRYSTAIGMV